jgi:hypothetical protein
LAVVIGLALALGIIHSRRGVTSVTYLLFATALRAAIAPSFELRHLVAALFPMSAMASIYLLGRNQTYDQLQQDAFARAVRGFGISAARLVSRFVLGRETADVLVRPANEGS